MAFLPQNGGGLFTIDPNATPEQLARKRELLAAMMPQFGNARYVGQGVGQLATGIAMGRQRRQMDKIEGANRDKITGMFDGLFSGGGRSTPPFVASGGSSYTPPDPNSPEGIAGDTMTALGKSPDQVIKAGLMQRGLPEHVADGFIMNFKSESGLDPAINEKSPLVPGSRGGYGLAQWTGPRRVALENFAASSGRSVSDPNVQLDFLMTELQGPEAKAAQSIMDATDAATAAQAIAKNFLRPAPDNLARRVAEYGGATPSVAQAGGGMDLKTLAEIAASPYATAGQRTMAEALLKQQMQAMDPAYALDLQLKRKQVEAFGKPEPVNAEYNLAVQQAILAGEPAPTLTEWKRGNAKSGAANVSVTTGEGEKDRYLYGTDAGLPNGWRLDRQTGEASRIPGGPEDVEAQQLAAKGANKDRQAKLKLGTSLTSIGLNIEEIENGGMPVTGPIGDARRTWLGRALTGSSAMDFGNRTSQVTDSAAFAEIQNMRDNSPTGGAVGQLTDKERSAIGNAVTALNNSTSAEEYLRAAKAYRQLALDLAYGEGRWQLTEDGVVPLDPNGADAPPDDDVPTYNPQTGKWE